MTNHEKGGQVGHPSFWVLDHPESERRLAEGEEGDVRFEEVHCKLEPEAHRGVRDRISPLSVILPSEEPDDFVWTWLGECLVQDHALHFLMSSGFTGYQATPATVRFKKSSRTPPRFWELLVKSSAGLAAPESGLRVLRKCPGCGLTDYSRIKEPTKVVDLSKWDGSDFLRVDPVSGWIFVTGRVVRALQQSPLRGWRARSLKEMKESFDIAIPISD